MSLDTIILSEGKSLSKNSTPKKLDIDQMYRISIEVIGKSGKPFCGYAGIVLLENDTEVRRKICWFNDFTGQTKTHQVVFKATTSKAIVIYRINNETPIKTECNFELTPIKDITIERTTDTQEKYDKIEDYTIPRPRELSAEEEDRVEKNIVWVLGTPLSGISMVSSNLLSHKTNMMDEPKIGKHLGTIIGALEKQVRRNIDHFRETPQYIFSKTYENTWLYYLRKLILNRIFAQFPDATEKITVIKEPTGTLVADIISKCLPNSKIIFLLRDGREAAYFELNSHTDSNDFIYKSGIELSEKEKRLEYLEKWSRHWVKRVEIMMKTFDLRNKELTYLEKYENIRKNTKGFTEKLYQFIGIDISQDDLNKIVKKYPFEKTTSSKNDEKSNDIVPGKWKENMSEKEQSIMNGIMKEMLTITGY